MNCQAGHRMKSMVAPDGERGHYCQICDEYVGSGKYVASASPTQPPGYWLDTRTGETFHGDGLALVEWARGRLSHVAEISQAAYAHMGAMHRPRTTEQSVFFVPAP